MTTLAELVSGRPSVVPVERAKVVTPLAVSLKVTNPARCGPRMLCHVPLTRTSYHGRVYEPSALY